MKVGVSQTDNGDCSTTENSKQNSPLNRQRLLSLWRGRVVLGLWETRKGAPTTWAKGPTRYTAKLAQNRWRNTLSWSHRMIHVTSGARTRTKSTASSSSFQRVLVRLVSTPYDGVIPETMRKCRLNPRWTWQLSRRRSPTWERSWRMCVQHGDILIT
jgi:hypothetical protein